MARVGGHSDKSDKSELRSVISLLYHVRMIFFSISKKGETIRTAFPRRRGSKDYYFFVENKSISGRIEIPLISKILALSMVIQFFLSFFNRTKIYYVPGLLFLVSRTYIVTFVLQLIVGAILEDEGHVVVVPR